MPPKTTKTAAYTGPMPTLQELERMLDIVRADVFTQSNAAFLGSLLCSHDFVWDFEEDVTETAATDGSTIWWSVKDFMRCSFGERRSTLVHELWHTGLLHNLRQGTRCPDIWNISCDWRINNNLLQDGFAVPNNGWWVFDPEIDKRKEGPMAEEEIYDLLMKNPRPSIKNPADMKPGKTGVADQVKQLGNVIRAVQAAKMAGQAGNLPGSLKLVLNTFLQPRIDWKVVLHRWMTDLLDDLEYSWARPNRRFSDVYLPSRVQDEGRLEHLVFFEDVSGSITDKNLIRFNSEVKHVKDVLQPKKLTLVQFDTKIQFEKTFGEDEPFERVEMHGRGGTCLVGVRNWIEKHKPTAAVIFSDLECAPMAPLSTPIPTIWARIRENGITPPFGTLICVKD